MQLNFEFALDNRLRSFASFSPKYVRPWHAHCYQILACFPGLGISSGIGYSVFVVYLRLNFVFDYLSEKDCALNE